MFTERDKSFWQKWAQIPEFYDNPYVLFGLLNEPHDVSWETWRNGGFETPNGEYRYGYQQIIEMVRDLGARNVILAGGLDWGYDLRGVTGEIPGDRKNYALIDQGSNGDKSKTGYGIIYDCHIYPWKGMGEWFSGGAVPGKTLEFAFNDWVEKIGSVRKIAPILSGECGWQFSDTANITKDMFVFREQAFRSAFMEAEFGSERWLDSDGNVFFEDGPGRVYVPAGSSNHVNWMKKLLDFFDDDNTYGSKMHYTAWCWHFGVSPIVLQPTGRNLANDPNNYGGWDATVAARISLLNAGSRVIDNPLSHEETKELYTPNKYSGIYFYEHMRQAARDRGEYVDD